MILENRLVPSFNVTEILKPYAFQMLINNLKPKWLFQRTNESYMDVQHLAKITLFIIKFFWCVDESELQINLKYGGIEGLNKRLSKIVDKLVITIITAVLLVGSSLLC